MDELKKLLSLRPSQRSLQVAREIDETIINLRRIREKRDREMAKIRAVEKKESGRES